MNAFAGALNVLMADPNVGINIVYRPAVGDAIACRATFAQPDIEGTLQHARVRDRRRELLVRGADIPQPEKGATVEVPAGGETLKVYDFAQHDPMRLVWKIVLAA